LCFYYSPATGARLFDERVIGMDGFKVFGALAAISFIVVSDFTVETIDIFKRLGETGTR